jgi:acetyl-CoA carboxylase, biotin carboxylase subunit
MSSSTRAIKRVLVANRGEIAVRVMRTCRERGIDTVAVYSDADRTAAHVLYADHAICVGPAPAAQSYLDIQKILAACRESGADAVHPGYGFLSENAQFADACQQAGVTFLGPPSAAIRAMGSKTAARATMAAAGVPVVPGDNGPGGKGFADAAVALDTARNIGFPVLLKAAAGGGGKGMRLVETPDQFIAALEGAKREALAAFGDDTVYIEKAILRPRHVEVQVFADQHGNVVHLGERDCSIQRRHQKVIEESPSPAVDASLRGQMGEIAVRAAQAVDYVGAGTVEFLLADNGAFYFLEMNTRLQVEHPVTEAVYGLDLVAWQIEVAQGKPLPLGQDDLDRLRRGAAIECRIYAEDSERFLPSPGTITHLRVPAGPYVRDDSGAYEGATISTYYDPLISKLIVWGQDRNEAVARLRRALDEYTVRGIRTNIPFHRRMVRHPAFASGEYDTGFIDRERAALCEPRASEDAAVLSVALAAAAIDASPANSVPLRVSESTAQSSPSNGVIPPWRLGARGWLR